MNVCILNIILFLVAIILIENCTKSSHGENNFSGYFELYKNKSMVSETQLVELKNGETYNGHLVSCDNWMNINLREVICTSKV